VSLADWAAEILEQCVPIAAAADAAQGHARYSTALGQARDALGAPDTLPSARVLDAIRRDFDGSYTRFIGAQSASAKQWILSRPYSPEVHARFEAMARESHEAQRRLEAADAQPFETWLADYLAPERLEL
jgi:glutamate--cysteine ligase